MASAKVKEISVFVDESGSFGSWKYLVETPTTGPSGETRKPVALPSRLRD